MQKKEISDCVACMMRPLLLMGGLCGLSVMDIQCPHSKNFAPSPHFAESYIFSVASSVFSLPLILSMIKFTQNLITIKGDLKVIFSTISELLLTNAAVLFAIKGIVGSYQKLVEMNGLAAIIENRCYYGFTTFIPPKTTRYFVNLSYFIGSVIGALVISSMIYIFLSSDCPESPSVILKAIQMGSGWYFQFLILAQFLLTHHLYMFMFKKCFEGLEDILKQRFSINNIKIVDSSGDFGANTTNGFSLEVGLQRMRRLYICLIINYQHMIECMNPLFLLWWMTLVAVLITNFYILIVGYLDGYIGDIVFTVRSYGGVLGVVLYSLTCHKINEVSDDILSFLFKYPISRLSTAEANQIEMLITTLTLEKPTLRASDIFTVGTGLLSSISGTVVTYVLVALQFHASWAN